MTETKHISVLPNEVLEGLAITPSDVIVDATVNGGGHASLITKELSDTGIFIGLDVDKSALEVTKERLKNAVCQVSLINQNFANIDLVLNELELEGCDKVLFDLGWSSNQFENAERGFSFHLDGPLLMTLSDTPENAPFTAYDIVNTWEASSLIDILRGYGEERYARGIAEAIVKRREQGPIVGTLELAETIAHAVPPRYRNGKIHPATKTFQALRIAVNNELEVLKTGLQKSFDLLNPGGRLVVISFHSLEDRIVKTFFKKLASDGRGMLVTKKPLTASEQELTDNRRSRSAKLRIIQKL